MGEWKVALKGYSISKDIIFFGQNLMFSWDAFFVYHYTEC